MHGQLVVKNILLTLLAMAPPAAGGGCGNCEEPGHLVHVAANQFFRQIKHYGNLSLPKLSGHAVPGTPFTYDVVVSLDGSACSITLAHPTDVAISSLIEKVIRTWQFELPPYEDRKLCLSARIFVYARLGQDKIDLIIPGLNSRR